jgi:hypothetical protein
LNALIHHVIPMPVSCGQCRFKRETKEPLPYGGNECVLFDIQFEDIDDVPESYLDRSRPPYECERWFDTSQRHPKCGLLAAK